MSAFSASINTLSKHGLCTEDRVETLMKKMGLFDLKNTTRIMKSLDEGYLINTLKSILQEHFMRNDVAGIMSAISSTNNELIKAIAEINTLVMVDEFSEKLFKIILGKLKCDTLIAFCASIDDQHLKKSIMSDAVKYLVINKKKVSESKIGIPATSAPIASPASSYAGRIGKTPSKSAPNQFKRAESKKKEFVRVGRKKKYQANSKNFELIASILGICDKIGCRELTLSKNPVENQSYDNMIQFNYCGWQKPRLNFLNRAWEYPFCFRVNEAGQFEFRELDYDDGKWYNISIEEARAEHVKYWVKASGLLKK